ncbi:MAG: hypothetical protein LC799_02215 [Actinobacteria bacterium]|nr:hypothetical protein [Actinomycetota bacterium]
MTEKFRVLDGEVDLEREDVRDSQNRRIDADYVERAVADVHSRRGPTPADRRHPFGRALAAGVVPGARADPPPRGGTWPR